MSEVRETIRRVDEPSKTCSTCHELRPLTDFNVRRTAADGLQARCRSCSRQWYADNREDHMRNVRVRNDRVRAEARVRLTDYLLEHPCVDCGESDVRVLDFDHEDPTTKLTEVGRLIGTAMPWQRVLEEIEKCSVRCANCHRRRTAEQLGYWRHEAETARRAAATGHAAERLEALDLARTR